MSDNKRRNLLQWLSAYGPYLALAALLLLCCISSPGFRKPQNLLNITRQVSYSGIIALGMTFVIIAGGIDLSVGSLLAFAGTLGILAMNAVGDGWGGLCVAIVVSLGAGLLGGALNGALINVGRLPPFIATLGTMSIFRSLTLQIAHAGTVTTSNPLYGEMGGAVFLGLSLPSWFLFLLTALGAAILLRTRFGRHVCATGSNERVARYAAIRTRWVSFATYAMVGLLAGLSGLLLGGRLSSISSSTAGQSYELDAIAAAIIGGTAMSGGKGSLAGTLAGVLILGIIANVLVMWGVSANLQDTVKGVVIIAAVLLQRKPETT